MFNSTLGARELLFTKLNFINGRSRAKSAQVLRPLTREHKRETMVFHIVLPRKNNSATTRGCFFIKKQGSSYIDAWLPLLNKNAEKKQV